MKHHSLLFALPFLLAVASPVLKGEETLQPASTTLADTRPSSAFYPLDSWPERSDFKNVLKLHTLDFSEILPHFVGDSFYELPDSKAAVSDHYVTWGEITNFLNNVAWRTGKDLRHLYTGTLAKTITRQCEKISLVESRYTYEVSEEVSAQPALLSLATLQRYVNWREGHYWRYGRLLDQEKGITDPDDAIVSYFENHLLWPMIKLDENIDNLYDVVEKSTEVGTLGFSEDGSHVEKMNSDVSYRLPTQEEISSWRGLKQPGKVWGITSSSAADPAACCAFDVKTGEQLETSQDAAEECYGILALNTEKMKSDSNFQKEEETLQSERAHFEEFVEQDLLQSTNLTEAYEKEQASSSGAVFSDGTNILMWGTGIGELASLGFAAYQGARALALYAAKDGATSVAFNWFSKFLFKQQEKEVLHTYKAWTTNTKRRQEREVVFRVNALANNRAHSDDISRGNHPRHNPDTGVLLDENRTQEIIGEHDQVLGDATTRASWWALGGVIATGFLEGLRNLSSTAY